LKKQLELPSNIDSVLYEVKMYQIISSILSKVHCRK